ncbi:hypothetical protein [Aquabacter spiritensis]|uniref:Uncharacterized protein n=1 Tax=Aquabacter spiritensis TaxID=933073 RepID=A0A4R3LS33_9HYPH|nr:hypothetical protein [Aquabacter spiritensis]TCT03322.1 hypothetical protein EDC64_110187 [Aquabacter spiritensis]
MSNAHPAQEPPRAEAEVQRPVNQSAQWRDIGITAVAAAARYAGTAAPAKSAGEPNKVVTLRDIDHLAA